MDQTQILRNRFENDLKQLICEAIASFDDDRIVSILITDVKVQKGRSDAFVYVDYDSIDELSEQQALKILKQSSGYISSYVLTRLDKLKLPKLHFKIDKTENDASGVDKILKRLENERNARENNRRTNGSDDQHVEKS